MAIPGGPGGVTLSPTGAPTYPLYVTQFLQTWGVPITPVTEEAMYLWIQAEGGVASNNPLNTSGAQPGATTCIAQCGTSSPIYAYSSLNQGMQANIANLNTTKYQGIKSAFSAPNATLASIWTAINQSSWCKGCGGGTYPGALYSALTPGYKLTVSTQVASSASAGGTAANCTPALQLPLGVTTVTILNSCQLQVLAGAAFMVAGGLVFFIGAGVLLAGFGGRRVPAPVALIAGEVQGRRSAKRKAQERSQAQEDRLQVIDARGQQRRATNTPRASQAGPLEPFPE